MGLLDKIQAKLELYRLEQRYTRRSKRTTFVSDAQYVDGEYVYQSQSSSSAATSPTSTGSSGSQRWARSKASNVNVREVFNRHGGQGMGQGERV
ncbi:hypothetical protein W97_04797 [Coniosporium apollinis CBS 100218]|uniref:Uncharacterized protein n=1 Tax=Coniosporium apollinis (strain CBS 100218) TaxID=1168221 RepID=R7YUS6_CONA1|nr:uncharacterized protein W97_04797 [Coniosporium apollinis CBS 100218]EON65559.1 hypothetical protein W97_04797 [Coniosporium apollinis CBS 100218]